MITLSVLVGGVWMGERGLWQPVSRVVQDRSDPRIAADVGGKSDSAMWRPATLLVQLYLNLVSALWSGIPESQTRCRRPD